MNTPCRITFVLAAMLLVVAAEAYNRGWAKTYAQVWYDSFNVYDVGPYWSYVGQGGDCANFVSQCLIAGKIYFRSSTRADDNTYADNKSEIDTGQNTKYLDNRHADANRRDLHSRVISGPRLLRWSLAHNRHGGTVYTKDNTNNFTSQDFWNDVRYGDVVIYWGVPDIEQGHGMFITTVDTTNKVLKIAAHSSARYDDDLDVVKPGWKTSEKIYVITLPDAPYIISSRTKVYVSPNADGPYTEIGWYWGDKRYPHGPNNRMVNKKQERLDIQLTFSTIMNTTDNNTWAFKLNVPGTGDTNFQGITGGGWENGWWMEPDDPTNERYYRKTWRGKIVGNIPNVTKLTTVKAWAKAQDSSIVDADCDLQKYNPGTVTLLKIDLERKPGQEGM